MRNRDHLSVIDDKKWFVRKGNLRGTVMPTDIFELDVRQIKSEIYVWDKRQPKIGWFFGKTSLKTSWRKHSYSYWADKGKNFDRYVHWLQHSLSLRSAAISQERLLEHHRAHRLLWMPCFVALFHLQNELHIYVPHSDHTGVRYQIYINQSKVRQNWTFPLCKA